MVKYLFTLFVSFIFFNLGYSQGLPAANLGLTQTVSPGPHLPANLVTYTLTVSNAGPDNATGVVVTDLLPPELTFVSAAASQGSYVAASSTFTVGTLNTGAAATLILVARIQAPVGTTIRNTATVAAAPNDPNPGNNTAITNITVQQVPAIHTDLAVTKTISPGPHAPGNDITYTITATNKGPEPAANVTLTDVLPPNLTFVQATANPGAYNLATGLYTIGNLSPGASATLTITATINTSGAIVNTATVTGTPIDRDNTNNTATAQTCVLPGQPAQLEINSSAFLRNVCSGQAVELKVPVVSGATRYDYSLPPGFAVVRQLGSVIYVVPGAAGGNITVTAVNSCGSSPALVVPVTVAVIPPVPAPVSGPATPCTGTQAVYAIPPVADAAAYSWTLPQGWRIIAGGTTTSVTVQVGTGAGEVVVKAANSCGGGSTQALPVNPVHTPAMPVIADSSNACAGLRYAIVNPVDTDTYTWTVPAGWTIETGQGTPFITAKAPNPKATGIVSVVARQDACASPEATYTAAAIHGSGLLNLPNAFSPNGDGQNDTYVIGNLEKYPENDIVIVNRWGNQVFKQVNYQNNWAATDLHDGTYFYVLRVKACFEEQKIYRGYITIAR